MATGAQVESMPAIYKDSIVAIRTKSGEHFYRVKRINAKTLAVIDAEGNEGSFKTPFGFYKFVREATADEKAEFVGKEFSNVVFYRVGNIVRWPEANHPLAKDRLLVVIKVNADGDCNLVPLGGVNTLEYFRAVPWRKLEKVDGSVTVANV